MAFGSASGIASVLLDRDYEALFTTCAQIIPVILLALAVEYRLSGDLVRTQGRIAMAIVVICGVVGEMIAIDALANDDTDSSLAADLVSGITLTCVLMLAIGTIIAIARMPDDLDDN